MKKALHFSGQHRALRSFLALSLMLFAFMAMPIVGWGQTTTVTYGWETSDDATLWTISSEISATSGQGNTGTYAGKINTNHTYVQFNEKVLVTSFSFAFKRTSNNSNYNVYIETSTDGSNWTAVETYTMGSFSNGSYTTKTKTFDGTKEYYVRFHCYNTTAVRYVDDVSITYNTGGDTPTPTTYTVTFDAGDGTFVGSTDFPNTSNTVEAGTYTLPSATPATGYTFDGWTATGITEPITGSYAVSGNVDFTAQYTQNSTPTPGADLIIDFESAADTYTNWTFTNMTSQQTGSITAHGGTNYGTTGGRETASIVTKSTIATPGSLTCYVSKQTNNTTSSNWYIQVSSDGSTWTNVESQSATSMSKGEWIEFTADLSSYTNV